MTWTLHATGHTPTPEGQLGWASVEQELLAELRAVLEQPKYGTTHSQLAGNHVNGPAHLPIPHEETETEAAAEADAEEAAETPAEETAEDDTPDEPARKPRTKRTT